MKRLLLVLAVAASCHAAAVYEYTFSDAGGSGIGFGPSLLPGPVNIALISPPLNAFQIKFGEYYEARLGSVNGEISVIAFGGDEEGPLFQDGVEFTVPANATGTFFGTQLSAFGANGPYVLTVTETPDPATLALLALGGLALFALNRKRCC